jgi:hypothetical protein
LKFTPAYLRLRLCNHSLKSVLLCAALHSVSPHRSIALSFEARTKQRLLLYDHALRIAHTIDGLKLNVWLLIILDAFFHFVNLWGVGVGGWVGEWVVVVVVVVVRGQGVYALRVFERMSRI